MIAVAGCRGAIASAAVRKRCLAGAEEIEVAPSAIVAVEAEKRCGASAEAIAMAPRAKGAVRDATRRLIRRQSECIGVGEDSGAPREPQSPP